MPPNLPTGPPSKEALRLALELERQGKSLEVQALRAVNAQYQGLDIRHLAALVGLVSDHAAPAERVANLAALMGAFREAALPLTQPPSRLGELLGQAVEAGMTASARMMGLEATRPSAQAEYTQHAAQRLGLYWNKEQTRLAGEVSSVLLEGLQRGQSAAQLTLRLRERLDVSRTRSRLVVANEVGNALAYANQQSQQEAGGTHYIWVTCHDERVRPAHQERDGKVFAWDNPPSDGHPGEPVRCRCVAVPDTVGTVAEQERIKTTKHIGVIGGFQSTALRQQVLRGAQLAGIDSFLEHYPLESLTLHADLRDSKGRFTGDHYRGKIRVSAYRIVRHDFGVPFQWGKVETVASAAATAELAMQRTFVHETGHYLLYRLFEKIGRDQAEKIIISAYKAAREHGNMVSRRAEENWQEYFCEVFSASTYYKKFLMQNDAEGFKIVAAIRQILEVNK